MKAEGRRQKADESLLGREGWRCHTPTVLQMEAVECGAAALGIILEYYGRIVPLAELRQVCGVSRQGVSAFNIVGAAKDYHLKGGSFKTNLSALRKLKHPYIVFWNFNHFLVVEGYSKGRVYLNDPATGPRSVSLEEFSGAYTGVLILLEPNPEFQQGGSRQSVVSALRSRLSGSTGALVYALVAGFLLVIPGLAIPTFSQVFVDDILIQRKSEWLQPLIVGIISIALLNGYLTLLQLQSLRRLKIELVVRMTSRFMWHLLRLPLGFYEQRFAGEISSRIQLNDSIANLLSGKLATTAIAAVAIIVYAVVMLQYDAILTAIAIAFVLVNLAILQWVRRQRVDANIKLIQEYGKVSGVGISGLQSMETLKASGLESAFFSRWAGHYALAINARQELEVTNQAIAVLPIFLSAIAQMLILAVGGWRVMDGVISIGMLVAFQGMMQRFLDPVSNLMNLGSELQEMEGNLDRLDDVLSNQVDPQLEVGQGAEGAEGEFRSDFRRDCKPRLKAPSSAPLPPQPPQLPQLPSLTHLPQLVRLRGKVELRNVTFGYSRVAPPVIENFNLELQPGQQVALVGGSGSGKSTIAKLLSGLYEPWSGEVLFDGLPRKQIERSVLANSLAAVEQEILLFAGSVRDNLTLWDSTVPDSSLVRACRDAAVHDVILSLPCGYDAALYEGGTNLSGGQRQRLEIARALVNNPTIVVMDEATSALDAETEKIVAQNLRLRGCSCIVVAHRLATIRDCDLIIVLEGGKVVQQGTHGELKSLEGAYKQLCSEAETIQTVTGTSDDRRGRGAGGRGQRAGEILPPIPYSPALQSLPSLPCFPDSWSDSQAPNAEMKGLANREIDIPGQSYYLKTNQSLPLDKKQAVWVVRSGNLALFAGTRANGISSVRRYLFSTRSGQAIFATALTGEDRHRLEAVALGETELLEISIEAFSQFFAEVKGEATALIEGWVHQIGIVDTSMTTMPRLPEPIHDSSMPLILSGLAQLHADFLNSLDRLRQREMDAELLRFQARERLERQLMQETLRDLSSVLSPPKVSPLGHSSRFSTPAATEALLIAAGAVGHNIGIEIRSPESFNLKVQPVEAIAHASQIRIRPIKLQNGWWNQDGGPMLAYTHEDKQPVALLPGAKTRYELFEPLKQTLTPVNSDTAAALAATAYVFYKPLPKKLNLLGLVAFALRGHHKEIVVVFLTGVAVSLLGMLVPQSIAILIDRAIPDANRGLLLQIAFGLAAAAFGSTLFQLAQGLATIRLETFADSTLQAAVWDRLLNLKADFFRAYSVGDLNSRASAIGQIRRRVGSTVLRTIFSSLFSLLNLGLLFYYSAKLALVASVVALVSGAIAITSGILTVRRVHPLLEREGQIFGVMVQLINSVAKLRVAKAEARAFAFWGKQYAEQLKLMLSTQKIEDFLAVVNQILPALTTAALFWFAAGLIEQSRASENGLSTGTFLAFNAAFGTFMGATTSLSLTVVEVLQVLPLWKRAEPIILAQPEIDLTKADPGRLSGMDLERVSFRYTDAGPLVLDDVSIHARSGEFIAIVGPSGSGKSTLLRLLLGFEFPGSGRVSYDGQDLTELDLHAVRRQLGVVLQNSRLMSAPIFDNIASGALITLNEAWEAARMAGLADDIAEMPMGMHTLVSEGGSNISGGQRQRLLIARALVLKPRILLFDEATSALDNRTQAIVSQSLEQLQVTRVAIAHRLSTIRHADRIYVLQNGRIVQHGSFHELACQPGLFAQLMQRQML